MTARRKFCSPGWRAGPRDCRTWWLGILLMLMSFAVTARADEFADAQRELQTGNYEQVIKRAAAGVSETPGNEEWHLLLAQGLLTVGRYAEADTALTVAMTRQSQSLRLRWLGREVALANGHPEQAARYLDDLRRLYAARPWFYREPRDLVVFGRAALTLGADPKDVLERVYGPVQKMAPTLRDVYLARGELALEKHDFGLAAKAFEEGLKQIPGDADLNCGLARAHEEGDRKTMIEALDAALARNPRHVPSLLLLADHRIDEENYPLAEKLLAQVVAVNPQQPDAWALRAVLAHLRNDSGAEDAARTVALRSWTENPRVDWLIGQKLAAKYRFAEGAARQRQALRFDPDYLPAKAELANDLLRLGEESEGWHLAEVVHAKDGYDVEAFNLATLHDAMAKYVALTNDDFVVRMTAQEAAIYGDQVLDLLSRARRQLTAKYGVELARPTFVEIFADPKDFAVRTFGIPDVSGFLGVCFGRVVTANSPASTASHGTNWESVVWHEFCHVVTLQLTRNKMPRWLSEGISVYEERQANPAWGQHMTPRYREMILHGSGPKKPTELTPVAEMSAAFLAPPTPMHLQFAYFQASLVVEYLVDRYGADKLRAVLRALGEGEDINHALARQIAPLDKIEKEFAAFARAQAEKIGPGLDWEKPPANLLSPDAGEQGVVWMKFHPDNYWTLLQSARQLIDDKKWAEAKVPLQTLLAHYPDQRDSDSALRLLAAAQRALNETELERATLAKLAALDDEAPDACLRLMELGANAKDWPSVTLNAHRFLEINPLVPAPYRYLAQADAALGDAPAAIAADRTLLLLDPANPAEVHFHLAQLLHDRGDAEARRQVVLALEDAPRNRAALNLLLELSHSGGTGGEPPLPVPPSSGAHP